MSRHFFDRSYPKARKQHCCEWCGEAIEIGEAYSKQSRAEDGSIYSSTLHIECDEALIERARMLKSRCWYFNSIGGGTRGACESDSDFDCVYFE